MIPCHPGPKFTGSFEKKKHVTCYVRFLMNHVKASISFHSSVLLITQKQCKTPLKRRLFIPFLIQHFEVKTLQTLWSLK